MGIQCPTWPQCWYAISTNDLQAQQRMIAHLMTDGRHIGNYTTPFPDIGQPCGGTACNGRDQMCADCHYEAHEFEAER